MVYIVAAVAMFAFAYYWWRGTAFGGFCMMWPMGIVGLFSGAIFPVQDQQLAFVTMAAGVGLAWGPYWFKTRRLAPAGSAWQGQTMEQAQARVADLERWMAANPGPWSGAPVTGSGRR